MQYRKDILYKKITENVNGKYDEAYIKNLVTFVFDKVTEWSLNPDNLILKIKYFGQFHWKYKNLVRDLETKRYYTDASKYRRGAEHQRFVDTADLILKQYDKWFKDKEDIKKLRYGDAYLPKDKIKEYYKNKEEKEKQAKIDNENNKNTFKISLFS